MSAHPLRSVCGLSSSRARSQAAFDAARSKADTIAGERADFRAAWWAERRAAAGLVSVSTSGFDDLPMWLWQSENEIEIDPLQARITRLRKSVGVASKCFINLAEKPPTNNVMVTLTYAGDNTDWKPRHVSDYIRAVRAWFKDRAPGERLRYVWVAELQDGKRRQDGQGRGVIHYHCIFFLPDGVRMPQADRKGWWPHGMTNTKFSTSPIAYLVSYAKKIDSKNCKGFPRGARISAFGGLDNLGRSIRRWCLLPGYVQGNASINDRFRPAPGGGYINAETGQLLQAEYAPTGAGFTRFVRVRTTPRTIDAAGPFSWLHDAPQTIQ